ncbi:GTP pyrophosphokinase family protein [Nocardioides sp.]|uniref:GTP pyrophosphokinase n=1 Tax=Nocardioides sp. TaxID=35761 RepID=UPI0027224796|nr:GTP pyrophosphokinase family protein [Nocardioides sp.]MDO9456993.1 GTP pyrophosphokinase family protein [Nocardioides sp.]
MTSPALPQTAPGTSYVDFLRALAGPGAEGRDPDDVMRELQARLAGFRQQYKFGIDEVLTKITILREEFEETHDYGPIEHVKTRLKSMDSLVAKMTRLGVAPDLDVVRATIRDIAGIRVTCAFVEDTYRFAEMLTRQPDLTVLETKDYIRSPKPNGYQSLHIIVEVPVFLSDRTVHVPVELQIRTIAMDFWASVEHQIYYKYDGAVPSDLSETLRRVAGIATDLDDQMGRLRDEIRTLAPGAQAPGPQAPG